jgi:hypothetical protein
MAAYTQNRMKPINTLSKKNSEVLNGKVGGVCKLTLCFKKTDCFKEQSPVHINNYKYEDIKKNCTYFAYVKSQKTYKNYKDRLRGQPHIRPNARHTLGEKTAAKEAGWSNTSA